VKFFTCAFAIGVSTTGGIDDIGSLPWLDGATSTFVLLDEKNTCITMKKTMITAHHFQPSSERVLETETGVEGGEGLCGTGGCLSAGTAGTNAGRRFK